MKIDQEIKEINLENLEINQSASDQGTINEIRNLLKEEDKSKYDAILRFPQFLNYFVGRVH